MRLLLGMPTAGGDVARLQPSNTGLTEWEYDPGSGRWTLHCFNEAHHLLNVSVDE
jgi:hypothetical protein